MFLLHPTSLGRLWQPILDLDRARTYSGDKASLIWCLQTACTCMSEISITPLVEVDKEETMMAGAHVSIDNFWIKFQGCVNLINCACTLIPVI